MERANRLIRQLDPNYVAAEQKGATVTGIHNGVAVISINYPPVNALNDITQGGIVRCVNQCNADPSVKAIVLTGSGKTFMAGMDISKIAGLTVEQFRGMTKETNETMAMLENGPKPIVAAVNGTCLGGGCEVAMACSHRVAFAKAKLGQPELNLGLIPGAGGTQRLPRLIGVETAVKITLSGRPLKAKAAHKAGLVDAVVKKPKDLIPTAVKLALSIAEGQTPRRRALQESKKVRNLAAAKLVVDGARLKIARKAHLVPHPEAFLRALWTGIEQGGEAGLASENEEFLKLVCGPTSVALRHFFFASRGTSKIPGLSAKPDKKANKVAVIGAGTMGAGIIIVFLMAGYHVILKEHTQQYLEAGMERIVGIIKRVIKKRKMNPMFLEGLMRNLTPQTTYDDFDKCDIVVEAVIENIKLKQSIFQELEKICNPRCILATNTSTIDIEVVGAKTKAMDRIVGLHFFSPAHIMPLLEIIKTPHTSDACIATTMHMAKRIKKTPVLVGNCVGFTANRVFFPYGQAASLLVDNGVNPYDIDKALEHWGMPMGVFKMADLSGVDIFAHVSKIINSAYGERCYNSSLGNRMMEAKRLGQKTGVGYYKYKRNKPVPDMKGLSSFIAAAQNDAQKINLDVKSLSKKDLVELVLFPVVNECFRVLDEGHVYRAADIDVVSVMGYGFPAFKGGLMHWAATSAGGLQYVRDRLNSWSNTLGANNAAVRSFFAPCPRLVADANRA